MENPCKTTDRRAADVEGSTDGSHVLFHLLRDATERPSKKRPQFAKKKYGTLVGKSYGKNCETVGGIYIGTWEFLMEYKMEYLGNTVVFRPINGLV